MIAATGMKIYCPQSKVANIASLAARREARIHQRMSQPVNVLDFRERARRRLPRMIFDYLEGGAEDEIGLQRNRHAFERIGFRPRRLVDTRARNTQIELFGRTLALPVVIAPTGLNALFWPHGDIALARSAARFGVPFLLSTASNESIEEVARRVDGDLWFQLYVLHPTLARQLVTRALQADYSTLVLTVDVVVNGKRERDLRNGFTVPMRIGPKIWLDALRHPRWTSNMLRHGMPRFANLTLAGEHDPQVHAALISRQMDASFSWDDLARLRDMWPRRLLVKGLSRWDDARRCRALGIDGVIFSNHGGRQLDSAISALEVLCEEDPQTDGVIMVDGGVRRGVDVVKARAAGADAVLLGRGALYGLAAAGEEGVDAVLAMLRDEATATLANLGCASMRELARDYLALPPEWHAARTEHAYP
jgi:(S)-mandelate dehydrogenase